MQPDRQPEALDDGETIPEPTAAESAQQSKEYNASARRLDDMLLKANPGQPAPAVMNFDRLVQSLYMTAAVQMGAGTAPNEQPRIDILGARQSIDMLSVLEEKTRGNLNEQEKRLLQNALFDLRMSFLEITNAIASSAQRPPQQKKPPGYVRAESLRKKSGSLEKQPPGLKPRNLYIERSRG